jgi:hypothetical protein
MKFELPTGKCFGVEQLSARKFGSVKRVASVRYRGGTGMRPAGRTDATRDGAGPTGTAAPQPPRRAYGGEGDDGGAVESEAGKSMLKCRT